jgi:para-nitrobenzyl esterase
MGEDCLSLNVWTTTTDRSAKKAVLVSFHGGGFATGSGNAPGFDGKNLAYYGDVVVVTVNHRLASFGYTNLSALARRRPSNTRASAGCWTSSRRWSG